VQAFLRNHGTAVRPKRLLVLALALAMAASGCVGLIDQMTSRNYESGTASWDGLQESFSRQDPIEVIRTSRDGAKRGRALASLREPLQHGGTQAEQELYVKLLTDAATRDQEPLCRLGAIRALGTFKDARALRALEDAYLQRLPFTAELNSRIRQEALASLQHTGHDEARHLLIRVARQPSASDEESVKDRQQNIDERLSAIRGLAKYSQYDSVETLLHVMDSEQDVALRRCAHESLQSVTGKRLPADPAVWRDYVHNKKEPEQPNVIQRVINWNKN
jgi:hypothetical protein